MNSYSTLQSGAPAALLPVLSTATPESSALSSFTGTAVMQQQQHHAFQQKQMQQQMQQQMQVQQAQQAHQAQQIQQAQQAHLVQQAHQAHQAQQLAHQAQQAHQAHQALQAHQAQQALQAHQLAHQAQQAHQVQHQAHQVQHQARQSQQRTLHTQQQQMLPPVPVQMEMPELMPTSQSDMETLPLQLPPSGNGEPILPPTLNSSGIPHQPIAEFLYQLTKMLSDNNDEIVEWNNGRIKVHYPDRLEGEVLHKYFRHSKFASFQRQLNYFGFRKIAGKGKMSPCSYVNDTATTDIRSLLTIKRKTNGSAARKAAMAQAQHEQQRISHQPGHATMMSQPGMMMQSVPPAAMTVDLFKNAFAAAGMTPQQMHALQSMAYAVPGTMLMPNNVSFMQAATIQAQQQSVVAQHAAAMQQRPLSESLFLPSDNALAALAHEQRKHSLESMASLAPIGMQQSNGSLETMSSFGSLGALAQAQRQSALNLAALFGAPLNFGAPFVPQLAPYTGAATTVLNGLVPHAAIQGPDSAASEPSDAASATLVAAISPQASTADPGTASTTFSAVMPSGTGAATAALAAVMPNGAATAALGNVDPASATAAMRAATAQANNMFENNANLNALVGKEDPAPGPAAGQIPSSRFSTNSLLRLPSSGAFFPDSFSTASLTGLLPGMSSNRLNSMLSLSSFFSRDPSMVDFSGNGTNFANSQFNALTTAPLSALTSGAPLSAASLAALQAAGAFPVGFSSAYPAAASTKARTPGIGFELSSRNDMDGQR